MKIFTHVFNTWFIANLFHPICWVVWLVCEGNEIEMFGWLYLFIGGLLLSIPSFLLSWILLRGIFLLGYNIYEKLFLWYLAVIISILFGVTIIALIIIGKYFSADELVLCVPSIVAAILSISVRYKSFTKLAITQNNN